MLLKQQNVFSELQFSCKDALMILPLEPLDVYLYAAEERQGFHSS